MARPRRNEHTREALIQAGIDLLSQHGYHGTGIKQILDVVNVPKGSFYNYFASKEAYVAEILQAYNEQSLALLDAYLNGTNEAPLQQIKTIYNFMLDKFAGQGCQQGCLIGSIAAEIGNQSALCQKAMIDAVASWEGRINQLFQAAQDAEEIRTDLSPQQITSVFWATWEGSLLRMKLEGNIEGAKETIHLMLDQIFKPQPAK